jgi:hypothetical protein
MFTTQCAQSVLQTERNHRRADDLHFGRPVQVGWYLQQFLKMGAARHVAGLSDYYLLWDSDMVPLKPMQWFVTGHANRSRAVFNTGGCVCTVASQVHRANTLSMNLNTDACTATARCYGTAGT